MEDVMVDQARRTGDEKQKYQETPPVPVLKQRPKMDAPVPVSEVIEDVKIGQFAPIVHWERWTDGYDGTVKLLRSVEEAEGRTAPITMCKDHKSEWQMQAEASFCLRCGRSDDGELHETRSVRNAFGNRVQSVDPTSVGTQHPRIVEDLKNQLNGEIANNEEEQSRIDNFEEQIRLHRERLAQRETRIAELNAAIKALGG